jgi:hypothetical protein
MTSRKEDEKEGKTMMTKRERKGTRADLRNDQRQAVSNEERGLRVK